MDAEALEAHVCRQTCWVPKTFIVEGSESIEGKCVPLDLLDWVNAVPEAGFGRGCSVAVVRVLLGHTEYICG